MTWQRPLPSIYNELTDPELRFRIREAKDQLGDDLVILGHHYQQDDVIEFADHQGDSFELSRYAAGLEKAKYVVFCGVHFMAETADILTGPDVAVILPDLGAGCSMADMADLDQTEECWEQLTEVFDGPAAGGAGDVHELVGRHQGVRRPTRRARSCTSSNARTVLDWALAGKRRGTRERGTSRRVRILALVPHLSFLVPHRRCSSSPDQHLGRNTGRVDGLRPSPPHGPGGTRARTSAATRPRIWSGRRSSLWKGHCSVHALFRPEHVDEGPPQAPGREGDGPPRVQEGGRRQGRLRRQPRPTSSTRSGRPSQARRGRSARRSTSSTASANQHPGSRRSSCSASASACARR